MFETKVSEYFEGDCDNFIVPATEVPEMVQLVLSWYYLQYLACLKLRVNTRFVCAVKKSPKEVWSLEYGFHYAKN